MMQDYWRMLFIYFYYFLVYYKLELRGPSLCSAMKTHILGKGCRRCIQPWLDAVGVIGTDRQNERTITHGPIVVVYFLLYKKRSQ